MPSSPESRRIPVVGIVGGIGSGKSHVARRWAELAGGIIVDGDAAGHACLTEPDVQAELRERFGAEVFDADGRVSRRALAVRVFGATAGQSAARHDLEAILHPRIRRSLAEQIQAARAAGRAGVILLDAAVLLEAGWRDLCDVVVFIDTPEADRLQRVRETRKWSREDFFAREAAQPSLEFKRSCADYVLSNPADSPVADLAILQLDSRIKDDLPPLSSGPAAHPAAPRDDTIQLDK